MSHGVGLIKIPTWKRSRRKTSMFTLCMSSELRRRVWWAEMVLSVICATSFDVTYKR